MFIRFKHRRMQRLFTAPRSASRMLSEPLSRAHTLKSCIPAVTTVTNAYIPSTTSFSFHTSSNLSESYRKRRARAVKKRNLERKAAIAGEQARTTPHPALGHPLHDDSLWLNSDLARILVGPKDLEPLGQVTGKIWSNERKSGASASSTSAFDETLNSDPTKSQRIQLPKAFAFGIGPSEQKLLFQDLPVIDLQKRFEFSIVTEKERMSRAAFEDLNDDSANTISKSGSKGGETIHKGWLPANGTTTLGSTTEVGAESSTKRLLGSDASTDPSSSPSDPPLTTHGSSSITARSETQVENLNHFLDVTRLNTEMLARITGLSNANARGIAFENRKRIVDAFSEGKPNDTGRSEVQAALLTWKIRNLWEHLTRAKHDIHNRRSLLLLLHQRAKVLKYLRRMDRGRYLRALDRIGVDARAVEGQIILR
ncbi:uncharacterized protein EI90DRAFT_3045378 [Cantharellus anzutake]|uniref:uncharacterized protein n=1 Tax=Cantharellus anzutake TaxID=1750568 RepID=UPI001908050F|nr:uncharacterized protein EI90DRAFT_3045378 [Cantharellus anzutake]KAF8336340.1 hypothetical protein EI90DRAFT_3045378 [Cantharellus anzutake]